VEFVEVKKEKRLLFETETEKSLEKWVIPFEFAAINFDDENKEVRPDVVLRVSLRKGSKC